MVMKTIIKNQLVMLLVVSSVLLFSFVIITREKKSMKTYAVAKGFAVVELFTSEGCSSCPSADAVIARLLKKNIDNIYILSFHVDYWNRLGWKDEFSQHAFSTRQTDYARSLNLNGPYTPQVVVNGTSEFVGSDENTLSNTINKRLKNGTESTLKIKVVKSNNSVTVQYENKGGSGLLLNCAIILPEATTQVRRGENSGRSLYHVNIVKVLKVTEASGSSELKVDVPKDLINKQFKLIAFTQKKNNLEIIGVDEVDF
jgi:hypothetical protein